MAPEIPSEITRGGPHIVMDTIGDRDIITVEHLGRQIELAFHHHRADVRVYVDGEMRKP